MYRSFLISGIASILALAACSKPPRDFTSYESTAKHVISTYEASIMEPDSTDIHRAEYYKQSPERWLLVYFKSQRGKAYIYQNFPESEWEAWNNSISKGKWYHSNLRGNSCYFFTPSE